MIKIIDLIDSKIIVAPECLVIEPFKSIWEKDKSKDKTQAFNMIKYTWYYASFKSPFFQHSNTDRSKLILSHIIKDDKFKVTKELEECIKMYEKINTTPAMKLFRAVQESINKMEEFFMTAEYNEDSITKIQKAIIDMPKMQEAIQSALNNCQKEQASGDTVRGQATLGLFEG